MGMKYIPTRSTMSEANMKRNWKVFAKIYESLYKQYRQFLPDSRDTSHRKLTIIDSTTISLFKEIMKNAGRKGSNGKRKGGIKVHVAMHNYEDVPMQIRLTPAAKSDVPFLKELTPREGDVLVFDKGYNSYKQFNRFTREKAYWVTRMKDNAIYEVKECDRLTDDDLSKGVVKDQEIILGVNNGQIEQVPCRLIIYHDRQKERTFRFITNNREMTALQIAETYKARWQIEMLFKRLKQNMPLQYFLGDNENAIKIQIYCALIADLLLKLVLTGIKRKWSFANLAALVRLHLMNYTDLKMFLNYPDKYKVINPPPQSNQLILEISP